MTVTGTMAGQAAIEGSLGITLKPVFFNEHPIPAGVELLPSDDFKPEEFLSNFSWHLMLLAFENGDFSLCQEYLEIVKAGNRLSNAEILLWKGRIASKTILSK